MISLPIYNTQGKEIDTVKLDAGVFGSDINTAAVHQAVCAYLSSQRKGLASTKTRGEVSGGGRKPWRQKGTGRARHGSIRSPLWRHGGVTFGPHPRDFSYSIPKKIKLVALKSVLSAKVKENNLIVLDNLKIDKPKTKEAVGIFLKLKIPLDKILLLIPKFDGNLKLAMRNIGFLDVNLASDTHTYEILSHNKLIITRDALADLTNRFKK